VRVVADGASSALACAVGAWIWGGCRNGRDLRWPVAAGGIIGLVTSLCKFFGKKLQPQENVNYGDEGL